MKNLMLVLTLCLYSVISNATTYYVSPTGSDSNPGTLASPFKTVAKLSVTLRAGDIAYLRGGTYTSTAGNGAGVHFLIENLTGSAANPIRIWAYPGETPVFDLSNITPTNGYPFAMMISYCNYVHIKGLTIKNLKQIDDGTGVSRGFIFESSNNCTAELLNVYNIGGTGVTLANSNGCTFLNCDSHNNGDGRSPDTWNFGDGFTCTGGDASTDITFDGCRTWMNGDDGWDFFAWSGMKVTIKNCWSFWNSIKPWGINGTQPDEANMTPADPSLWATNTAYRTSTSSGEGFKLGGFNVGGPGPVGMPTTLKKYLINCVSFENSGTGYSENMLAQYSHKMSIVNCIAFNNGNDGFGFGVGRSVGIAHIFKNNWAWNNNKLESGADWVYDGLPDNVSNNYWASVYQGVNYGNLKGSVTVNASDFLSTTSTGVTGSRQADGSLPSINFLKLVSNSDMIDKGINIGNLFNGSAPDLGAFESTGGAVNIAPTANAGPDINIMLPTNSVSLTGSGTDPDGTIASYAWTQVAGPTTATIMTATSATTTVAALNLGTYQFQLTVTDNSGATATDNVIVVVITAPIVLSAPTANAGADKTITLPTSSVSVTGSGTSTGGTISAYAWTKVSGPSAGTIAAPTAATTNITGLAQGVYKYELKVTDNSGLSGRDTMQVTVNAAAANQAPTANAGADQTITLPTNSVTLSGSGTDPDGTIASYAWAKISGPTSGTITAATAASTTATGLVQGTYSFQLTVTDNAGATGKDTVKIRVNAAAANQAPTANAGADQTITLPANSVTLSGSGTDADGTIASYTWAKVSGPTSGTITTVTAAGTTVTGLTQGVYIFELTVTDNAGATGKDSTQVTVKAAPVSDTSNHAYGGVRWPIPGKIQAEDFDEGGQGSGYYDSSPGNNGGVYRPNESVDIQNSTDNSPNIGWIVPGEWLKYSVNVTTSGIYNIDARIASPAAGNTFRIEMDGITIATVSTINTGSTQAWRTVTIKNISLSAGIKTMRIYAARGNGYNINFINFKLTAATARGIDTEVDDEVDVNTTVSTFPLPFATSFTVNLYGETQGLYNLNVVDMYGKVVWKKEVNKTGSAVTETIYMGNLISGVYFLNVLSPDNKKTVRKLIKN